ncbi:mitochondrial uncoupling protein 2-like isoform X1 [Catharus ustulatus]|uniref:mitochondrial uncoupling protein 2-like isoform X1 n=1 Tax=Catharus ustulatus TaxID=91951 RepID=UPI00140E080E|nr:mitochondrial uncoupling protein 2-like isoform X1 [Catharus ustulatus]
MVGLKPPEVPPTITMKFISAGMAGCITDLCTFPLDTAKVRLQAAHLRVPAGLGVPAGPGVPTPALSRHRRGHAAPGWLHHGGCGRGLCAAHRRGQGAVPGQRGPVGQRAPLQQHCGRYRTIAREEGIHGLWRGTLPNIARNAVINCGELVTYDLIKDALLRAQLMADNVPCHFVAAFGAGFCATVAASPVDVVKTQYMNATPGQYSNALSCLLALLTQDGPAGLYKGAIVLALRVTPVKLTFSITFGAPNNFPLISNYSDPAGAGDKPLALHGQGSRPVSESQHGPDVLDMVDVLIEGSDGFDEAIGFSLSEDMIIQTFPFSAVVPAALEARNILLLQSENGTGR